MKKAEGAGKLPSSPKSTDVRGPRRAGPTDPRGWRPRGDPGRAIRGPKADLGDTEKALSPAPGQGHSDLHDTSVHQPHLPHPSHPEITVHTAGSLSSPSRKHATSSSPGPLGQDQLLSLQAFRTSPSRPQSLPSPARPDCLQETPAQSSPSAGRPTGHMVQCPARPGSRAQSPWCGPPPPPFWKAQVPWLVPNELTGLVVP